MLTERKPLPFHPDHPGMEQWVDLRAVSTLRAGDRKAVDRAKSYRLDENNRPIIEFTTADAADRDDALLTRIIVAWSYSELPKDPLPVPVADPSSLDEIPLDAVPVFEELLRPYREALDFTRRKSPTEKPSPDGSSDSRTTSPDITSPDTSPTPPSSPSPTTPAMPPPSAGPQMM